MVKKKTGSKKANVENERLSRTVEQLLEKSLGGLEKIDAQDKRAARIGARKAEDAVKNLKKAKNADLKDALRAAIKSNQIGWATVDRIIAQRKGCDGTDCTFGCSVGCAAGCLIGGGTTIAFGILGGTAGGSGTAIVMDNNFAISF